MKWEYYNIMTQKDQEEYNYRKQKKTKYINFRRSLTLFPFKLLKVWSYISLMIVIFTLFIKDSLIKQYTWVICQENIILFITKMFAGVLIISFAIILAIIITYFEDLNKNGEEKWLKTKGYDIKFAEYDIKQLKEKK